MIGFIIFITLLVVSIVITAANCYIDGQRASTGRATDFGAWRLYM
jgi:hypothetical protein